MDSSGLNLSEEEERAARRLQEIAARAEAKAEAARIDEEQGRAAKSARTDNTSAGSTKFLTKAERERLALERLEQRRQEQEKRQVEDKTAYDRFTTGKAEEERRREARLQKEEEDRARERRLRDENKRGDEFDHELKAIREHYLGGKEVKKRAMRNAEKFAKMLKFDWDDDEDTGRSDKNPLYNDRLHLNPMFGRGYIAGIDLREQRKDSKFLEMLSLKRAAEARAAEALDEKLTVDERRQREIARAQAISALKLRQNEEMQALDEVTMGKTSTSHWSEKALDEMTERDWRIFREDFDIRIQGGRATLPLRNWSEANFPKEIMRAIEDVKYTDPSPIQRQTIPVGLEKRDIIGIAETGSGKTAAFSIPMLVYMLGLPRGYIDRCADQGPLAVIMAPARELAQQIEQEIVKLAKYTGFETACIVGGQDIEQQGFKLRKGVHIIVGTPGRIVSFKYS
jgi:ATP-dependent RNA helicase DDX23/PRP28